VSTTYVWYELLRTFRNRRFFLFSIGFPLVLYYLIAGPNRDEQDFLGSGLPAPVYYMVGLVAFGTMTAVLSAGARISAERSTGWNRQLRITPLRPRAYFSAKILTGYVSALATIAVLYVAGASLGVSLPAQDWLAMTGLILVGLVPFAALGVFVGHLLTADVIGPAAGGLVSLLALVSGNWYPLGEGTLSDIAQFLPSYWLVQASHVSLGGPTWSVTGWLVIGAWTLALVVLARVAYRRDSERV
jgi:ABC-2 type transport system permease protein